MKRTNKQQEIIDLSKKLFSQKGYVETSMRDLAEQLNIKAASLYSHFKSKEEILTIICDEIYDMMDQNMTIIAQSKEDKDKKFLLYIKLHITAVIKNLSSFEIYNKYYNVIDESSGGKYTTMNVGYFIFVKDLVHSVFPRLQDLTCYVPNATPMFILEMLNNVTKLINPENPDIDAVVEDIQMRLMYGFKKEKY